MPGTVFPPAAPTVTNTSYTVEHYLKNPTRVERRISDLAGDGIAARIYGTGTADGGAVIYDQLTSADNLYTDRDVQAIEPGSAYPLVDVGEGAPKVAAVSKWGAAGVITYEAAKRDRRDILDRKLTRIGNTITKKIDAVGVAALNAAPIDGATGTDWSSSSTGDPVGDIAKATNAIDYNELGYTASVALINPAQELDIFNQPSIRNALPRENQAANPVASGKLGQFMGLTWYVSNRVPAGTAYILAAGQFGSMHDEQALTANVIDDKINDRYIVKASRITVPVVTDPLGVYKLTGL